MAESQDLVPYKEKVTDDRGILSSVWSQFFRRIQDLVFYIQKEKIFVLTNNQAVAADVVGLSFDKKYYSQAIIEYLIQRYTSGVQLIETGRIVAVYLPGTTTWNISKIADLSVGVIGVTFSITTAGQIQYTSTNEAGTAILSRLVYRVRSIEAKSSLYSQVG